MALDNSLYDDLQESYRKIERYLGSIKMGPEHSPVIIKLEQLAELLETFDIEALEEQTKALNALHEQLGNIKVHVQAINAAIDSDGADTANSVAQSLDNIFDGIKGITL